MPLAAFTGTSHRDFIEGKKIISNFSKFFKVFSRLFCLSAKEPLASAQSQTFACNWESTASQVKASPDHSGSAAFLVEQVLCF